MKGDVITHLPRIVVVDHTGKLGGGELALLRVAERLQGDRADIQAVVFADGPFPERLRRAGFPTAIIPLDESINERSRDAVLGPIALFGAAARMLTFVPRLAHVFRRAGAELIIANTLKSAVFVSLAAPLAGRRWVWHLHDRLATDYLPRPLVAAMRALAVIGPRRIVANSFATLETLPPRARRKTVVAYPGLPDEAFARDAGPSHPATIGIIGRISPTKGQRQFLDAAAAVAPEFPDVRFVVIGAALFGEDDYETAVRAIPGQLGIGDRVEFTGWVDDTGRRLRELTALVHASPVPEPFGQVVAEAMAAGVPVVATAAGGVLEILDPSGSSDRAAAVALTPTGIMVRPGDVDALTTAIRHVLGAPEDRRSRADAAVVDATARFTIARTAETVWAAWDAARRPTSRSAIL